LVIETTAVYLFLYVHAESTKTQNISITCSATGQ